VPVLPLNLILFGGASEFDYSHAWFQPTSEIRPQENPRSHATWVRFCWAWF